MKNKLKWLLPFLILFLTTMVCSSKNESAPSLNDEILSGLTLQETYNKIAEINMPAVVSIQVTTVQTMERSPFFDFFGNDEFLRKFFGAPKQRKRKGQSFGSGFVISADGYLISNFHVVKNAEKIIIIFKDSDKEYEAEIVGTDPDSDVALLKITEGDNFPHVTLGDSESVKVGDLAVAIGNPFGLRSTFTTGVISAKGRRGLGKTQYEDFLQTDVAINPGNSGGPLINIKGKVIGVNSMIFSRTGGNIGIGFAIPINMVKNIITQLKENGKVVRGWLGVSIMNVNDEMAEGLDIEKNGVYIPEVVDNSPADEAGIEAGDIILRYDDKAVDNQHELQSMVAATTPGDEVKIVLLRKGEKKEVEVEIEARESRQAAAGKPAENRKLGITVAPIPPKLLQKFDSDEQFGVMIESVEPDSPFAEKGIRSGDIIRMINYIEIKNTEHFNEIIDDVENDDKIVFHIQRGSYLMVVVIHP